MTPQAITQQRLRYLASLHATASADDKGRIQLVADLVALPADPLTERRLLASLVVEPSVLELANDLEEQDFTDPRCRFVLRGIRQLRACEADVGLDEIDQELRLQDMTRERHGAGAIADKAGFWFIAELLLLWLAPYRDHRVLVEHDLAWLRQLADQRRALRGAA